MAKRGRANTAKGRQAATHGASEEFRNAHAGGPRQGELPKLSVLPQTKCDQKQWPSVRRDGTEKAHWGSRTYRGERIPFAKFIDIVYIPWFHCTVACRVKVSRGTGKPINVT